VKKLVAVTGALLPLVIAFFALSHVIFSPGFLEIGDFSFPLNVGGYVDRFWYSWNYYSSASNYISVTKYYFLLLYVLNKIGLSSELINKLVFFIPYYLSGVSMFFAMFFLTGGSRKINRVLASSVASISYMLFPPILGWIQSPLMLFGSTFLPISIIMYIKALDSCEKRLLLLTAATLSLFFTLNIQGFLYAIIIIASYQPFTIIYSLAIKSSVKGKIINYLKVNSTILLFFILLNFFIVIPFFWQLLIAPPIPITSSSSAPAQITSALIAGIEGNSRALSFIDVLQGTLRTFWFPQFPVGLPQALRFIVPIMAFSAVILIEKRYRKEVIFLALIALFSIFFTNGTNPPTGWLFLSLVNIFLVPFPLIFRVLWDTDKFFLVTSLSYSMLIGFSLLGLLDKLRIEKTIIPHRKLIKIKPICVTTNNEKTIIPYKKQYAKLALTLGLLILMVTTFVISSGYPLGGDLAGKVKPSPIPQEYVRVNEWLSSQGMNYRVLWLPALLAGIPGYIWNGGGGITAFPETISSVPFLPTNSKLFYSIYFEDLFRYSASPSRTSELGNLLSTLNVKYVIFHNDTTLGYLSGITLSNLMRQSDLRLIQQDEFIYVFENTHECSEFYVPNKLALVVGPIDVLQSMTFIENLSLTNYGIIFAEQLNPKVLMKILPYVDIVIFYERSSINDLALLLANDRYTLSPYFYTNAGGMWETTFLQNVTEARASSEDLGWYYALAAYGVLGIRGDFDLGKGLVLLGSQNVSLTIPFNLDQPDTYEVWVRVLEGWREGILKVSIDGKYSELVNAYSSFLNGLQWIRLPNIQLGSGVHNVTITNIEGKNVVNVIKIIPVSKMAELREEVLKLLKGKDIAILYEGETLRGNNAIPVQAWPYPTPIDFKMLSSYGAYLLVEKGGTAYLDFFSQEGRSYMLYVRTTPNSVINGVVSLNGKPLTWSRAIKDGEEYYWFEFPLGSLTQGTQNITFTALNGAVKIDEILILASSNPSRPLKLEDFVNPLPIASIISFHMENPAKWEVYVNASKPFVLAFAESFDPLWTINGVKDSLHLPLYSTINGFFINRTGIIHLTVEYEPQRLLQLSNLISLGTWLFLFVVICIFPIFRKMKK